MGKITTEGLADQVAALLNDDGFELASQQRYETLLDSISGASVRLNAQGFCGSYRWAGGPLWQVRLESPLADSDYRISPIAQRITATTDRRPSVWITGLPVDIDQMRRLLLEPLLLDQTRSRKYLERLGLRQKQMGDDHALLRQYIETGRAA